jgi:hypothetical protein
LIDTRKYKIKNNVRIALMSQLKAVSLHIPNKDRE